MMIRLVIHGSIYALWIMFDDIDEKNVQSRKQKTWKTNNKAITSDVMKHCGPSSRPSLYTNGILTLAGWSSVGRLAKTFDSKIQVQLFVFFFSSTSVWLAKNLYVSTVEWGLVLYKLRKLQLNCLNYYEKFMCFLTIFVNHQLDWSNCGQRCGKE